MKYSLIPELMLDNIYEITPEFLKSKGIRGLVLDIDNTLVPYSVPEPDEKLIKHLKDIQNSGIQIGLVSNNDENRVKLFNRSLNFYAVPKANKPSAKCVRDFLCHNNIDTDSALFVGDQLFTDCLAAHRAGVKCIIVKPLKTDTGLFFRLKRTLEKPFIAKYRRKKTKEL